MKKFIYVILVVVFPAVAFSQGTEEDLNKPGLTERMLAKMMFNPNYALELRYEGQKCNKISRFIDFSIAPLW